MTRNSDKAREGIRKMERISELKAAEAQRIALAKLEQARATRGRVKQEILDENGRSRLIHKVATTADRLVKSGKLSRGHKILLDSFAQLVADALGCATVDGDDPTSKLTSAYEPQSSSGFGSRSLSDRRLQALEALRHIRRFIPPELVKTFTEIAAEEVGSMLGKPRSLRQIGEARGYASEKQASAAGGTEVAILVEMLVHLMREFEVPSLRNVAPPQQLHPNSAGELALLEGIAA